MSRLTKFITQPRLFFRDMILKKLNAQPIPKNSTYKQQIMNEQYFENNEIKHLIHTGEGLVNGSTHLTLWLDTFENSGENYAVLVRNNELYQWLNKAHPEVNAIYARTAINVESVLTSLENLKGIYYLSNTGNLIHSLRFNDFKHIFLGHGDSDKAASAHKFFRVYDEIWVSGQAHIDRFKNSNFETKHMDFYKVGRPILKKILSDTLNKDINKKEKSNKIVYLPTWEGGFEENNYSSVFESYNFLPRIQSILNCDIMIKYHPATGTRDSMLLVAKDKTIEKSFGNLSHYEFIEKSKQIKDIITQGDIFICDISAVVSECISALAPIFIYIPVDKEIVTSNSNMQYSDYAYTFSNQEQLIELINIVVVRGDDYLSEKRKKALDYLVSINETLNTEINNQLIKIRNIQQLN